MKLRIYCLACRKHTSNIASRKVTMTNKIIRDNQGVMNVCLINQGF